MLDEKLTQIGEHLSRHIANDLESNFNFQFKAFEEKIEGLVQTKNEAIDKIEQEIQTMKANCDNS